jgi:hypothetical protein
MKKILLISFLILFAYNVKTLQAQNYNFSDKIKWMGIQKISVDSLNSIERLSFVDAAYYEQEQIPVYFDQIDLKNGKVVGFSWTKRKVEPLDQDEKLLLKRYNINLPDQFDVSFSNSIIRKQHYAHINMVPLRKNPDTGEPEKLIEFSLKLQYEQLPEVKSQRTYADKSIMNTGEWYKIRVGNSGIYELSYSDISSMGFDDPAQVGVYGYGGMVPKKNAESRHDDIPQRPVYLQDNNGNDVFDAGDALLVYLEGPDKHVYEGEGVYKHEIHNYSDHAYYFLSDADGPLFIETLSENLTANRYTSSYDYYKTLEKDSINLIASGRNWFWRHFDYDLSYSFNMGIPSVDNTEQANLYASLAARSKQNSRFKVTINGNSTYSGYIDYVSGSSTDYYAKKTDEQFSINPPQASNTIKIEYMIPNTGSEGWLDYLTMNARALLNMQGSSLRFRDSRTVGAGNITQYTINEVNSNCVVLDITDPVNAHAIEPDQLAGEQMKFTAESEDLCEFVVFDRSASFSTPQIDGSEKLGFVSNQNLHGFSNVDYVIVTNGLFSSYAQQLAEFHQSLHGLNTIVVDQEKIFNEFSSGTPDVAAVRDFMRMLYNKAESVTGMPKYLLLFGDGSYDNKTTTSSNTNYILTYQSTNGIHPTHSFVSDDFFGLLDDNEGTVSGAEGLDVGIGRLPVKSQNEAQAAVDKIFNYANPDSYGSWRNVLCFIGDDEDSGSHQEDASEMGDTIMEHYPVFNARKILLDAYEQISTVQGSRYPDVNQAIDERVNKGALIMNYSGHGNTNSLAHEAVVTMSQINSWNNLNRLPLFLTATCEFSRFDDYEFTSAGEQIFLNPEGGGIGLLTTTRMVYAGANFNLNSEFYRQVFKRDENNDLFALGEIIMHTKNNISDSNNKRNFVLLGDPALKLAIPEYIVETDSVNGVDVSVFTDTAGAASHITVTGHVEDREGNIMTDFNGTLYPYVFDKVMEYTTLGNDDCPPFPYKEQKNVLYSGKASIEDGYFSFEFIVPVDIAYYFDNGKISYYAESDNADAHGYFDELIIGGSSDNIGSDVWGPDIELYMNNTDFVDGGITDEKPDMLAFVYDESGINTVGNGIGHDIVAVLDDNTADAIILNDYYEADLDSYQSGTITYPFRDLDAGMHSLRVKVWDVFNNSAESEISFMVANSSELVIEQLGNYPNPFTDQTCFTFTHNHAGEQLDVEIKIYTMNGGLIKTIYEQVYTSGYTIDPICWQAGNSNGRTVEPGVYVYHVKVRAANGDVVNKFKKMVFVK